MLRTRPLIARPPPIDDTPEVHGDYAFFRDRQGDKDNAVTLLVLKDRRKKAFAASMVPSKGSGSGFVIKQFERDLKRFGHRGAISLRSDGELAIRDLFEKVATYRAQTINVEYTPKGDS